MSLSIVVMSFEWIQQEHYGTLFAAVPDPSWLRIVGGAVRNTLLGLPVTDVDIATRYSPQDIMDFYRRKGFDVIPTGLSHGTVTVHLLGHTFEITTLRRDVHTDGRHATVAFTDSWAQDAQRRDFTINALYVDCHGVLYDDVGGLQDLSQGVLRFIGSPDLRIQEDYLRILRFFRFWASYARTPDPTSLAACGQWKQGLIQLSKERVTSEILKIMALDRPWEALKAMAHHGIVALIHQSTDQSDTIDYGHRITIMEQLEQQWGVKAPSMVRLWAIMPCPHHATTPALMLLTNKQRQLWRQVDSMRGTGLDEWALFYHTNDRETVRACIWAEAIMALGQQESSSLVSTHTPDTHTPEALECGDMGKRGVETTVAAHVHHCREVLRQLPHQHFPPFELKGTDIMALGVSGPEVGAILKEVKNRWIHHRGTLSPHRVLQHLWSQR